MDDPPLYIIFFTISFTFKGLCPPPDLWSPQGGKSHEYSIFSRAKSFNQKPYFLLRKCAKTYLQQCRISKFSGAGLRTSRFKGRGEEEGEIEGEVAPWALDPFKYLSFNCSSVPVKSMFSTTVTGRPMKEVLQPPHIEQALVAKTIHKLNSNTWAN